VSLGDDRADDSIPKEDARDLATIRTSVMNGIYATFKDVDDAISLMLDNARIFNGEGIVVDQANGFGRWWQSQRVKLE
jgi:transcription initiation factor TFIID subunit 2